MTNNNNIYNNNNNNNNYNNNRSNTFIEVLFYISHNCIYSLKNVNEK